MAGSQALRSVCFVLATALFGVNLLGDQLPARHHQGDAHAFLVLKNLEGKRLATGDVTVVTHGARVTARLIFRFRDGSIDDDTTVFSQDGMIRLISDHHIQKGPSFPHPVDAAIDAVTGQITMITADGKRSQEHLDLPADVANGLPPNLLLNIAPGMTGMKISYVIPGSRPRLIHITIKPGGEVPFTVGGTRRKAIDYVLHVELGGLTGVIAPLIGKQPDDFHIWVLPGRYPAIIREEGQLYEDGPIWQIEQVSPSFSR